MSESTLDPRSDATRKALLYAAARIFADAGFKAARSSDIAALAQTPISAINYHFGSKRGLYDATLLELARKRIAAHPLPVAEASAEQRLRLTVHTLLNRLLNEDESSLVVRLMMTEVTQNGSALALLTETVIKPQADAVLAVLRELLGVAADDAEVRRFFLSFFGQCAVYLLAKPMLTQLFPDLYTTLDRAALAQHISAVMLAAIAAREVKTP